MHEFHPQLLIQKSLKQNILIIMTNTPHKPSYAITQPNSILKIAIEQKLTQKSLKMGGKSKLQQQPRIESFETNQYELELLETIELYQSKTDKGYFRFENWMKFNQQLFGYVREQTICSLWKIVRIINHGAVAIPTGLIYQISYHFLIKNKSSSDSSYLGTLKQVINEFLRMSKTNQFINNFRELSNYPDLDSIEQQYCPLFYKNIKSNPQKIKNKVNNELYDRLYKQGRKREQSIRQLKYASMARELQQCKFTPNISNYKSKTSLKKCERICKHGHAQPVQPKQEEPFHFVAREIDKKIYEGKLDLVPGVQEHIKRAEFSQAERQRVKRISSKPWLNIR